MDPSMTDRTSLALLGRGFKVCRVPIRRIEISGSAGDFGGPELDAPAPEIKPPNYHTLLGRGVEVCRVPVRRIEIFGSAGDFGGPELESPAPEIKPPNFHIFKDLVNSDFDIKGSVNNSTRK